MSSGVASRSRSRTMRDHRTGGRPVSSPRRFLWYVTLAVVSGVGSGILIAGAGGRLAMRLLAATASEAAQGRVTEADEVVGRISTGGTIGFTVFAALFFGMSSGVVYLLIRRWLPRGRLGGLTYGAAPRRRCDSHRPVAGGQPRLRHRRPRVVGRRGVRSAGHRARHARGRRGRVLQPGPTAAFLDPPLPRATHSARSASARRAGLRPHRRRRSRCRCTQPVPAGRGIPPIIPLPVRGPRGSCRRRPRRAPGLRLGPRGSCGVPAVGVCLSHAEVPSTRPNGEVPGALA